VPYCLLNSNQVLLYKHFKDQGNFFYLLIHKRKQNKFLIKQIKA